MATLAKEFLEKKSVPSEELRPQLTSSSTLEEVLREIHEIENNDTRTPEEKLEQITNVLELFIFFTHYDGITTGGRIGFNLKAGPPGSINHKRSFLVLKDVTESAFRLKGKEMACLAKEFIDKGVAPAEARRPSVPRQEPTNLLAGAAAAGYI